MSGISRRSLLPLLGGVIAAPAVFAADSTFRRHTFREVHMGMIARITLYARHAEEARQAAKGAFSEMADIDKALSHFNRRSEAMALGKVDAGSSHKVSRHLYQNLRVADEMTGLSEGLFDVTVAPLTRLWRESRRTGQLPQSSAVAEAKARVGWAGALSLISDGKVQINRADVQLDFGGLGKGYGADRAMAVLKEYDIKSALVELGGDIVVSDTPPEADGWRVSLQQNGVHKIVSLKNTAISTTGDSEQYLDNDGVRYSHIITPWDGIALTKHRQISVVGESGQLSDALASSLAMMERSQGHDFAEKYFKEYIIYEV